jgi:hypothetical protein
MSMLRDKARELYESLPFEGSGVARRLSANGETFELRLHGTKVLVRRLDNLGTLRSAEQARGVAVSDVDTLS